MARRRMAVAVAGLLALSMSVMMPATAAAETPPPSGTSTVAFVDLPNEHWAYQTVTKLQNAGVVTGGPDARFRPEDQVTRAELLAMLLRARKIDLRPECAGVFPDVPCTAWYASVVETAYRMGVIDGHGGTWAAPDEAVTREDLFDFFIRALGLRWKVEKQSGADISASLAALADGDQVSWFARPAVAYAHKTGLASGYGDGRFRPKAYASRAEAAAVVSRALLAGDQVKVVEVDGRRVVYAQAFEMRATMYSANEPGIGTETYTGLYVRPGIIAVDPTVIPLGSLLYVEGYGYGIAADTGGAILGHRVDLYSDESYEAVMAFGIQPRRVWVLP